jgi:hypothetical protein
MSSVCPKVASNDGPIRPQRCLGDGTSTIWMGRCSTLIWKETSSQYGTTTTPSHFLRPAARDRNRPNRATKSAHAVAVVAAGVVAGNVASGRSEKAKHRRRLHASWVHGSWVHGSRDPAKWVHAMLDRAN